MSLQSLRSSRGHECERAHARQVSALLAPLSRWARGQLPRYAKTGADTDDIVQDAVLGTLRRLAVNDDLFGDGRGLAYLRRAVRNRVVDEVRKARRVEFTEPGGELAGADPSPLDEAIGRQAARRYEAALSRLSATQQDAVVARIEFGLDYTRIAEALGKPSRDAARMTVNRALVRLAREMGYER